MAPDEMAGSVLDPNTARVRAGAEYGFPVGTAAQVLPMAQPAQAAAMAAGRAGERLAGRVVPQIMERGGMGAEMLQGMSRGTVSPMDVYHGSPHKFDRFDASKIGTGEGAQAYGHGLYFAENPNVAQQYKDQLSPRDITRKTNSQVDDWSAWAASNSDDSNDAMRKIDNLISRSKANSPIPKGFKDWNEFANLTKEETQKRFGGSLYKVDLPDEQIAKMLDWDKPMTESEMNLLYDKMQQSPLASFAKPFQDNFYSAMERGHKTPDGQDLFMELSKQLGGQKYVSEALRELGIPGIKYLDATSRGAGTGTRNFVTFPGEEQSMTILERNGQPMVARTQQQDAAPDLLQYQQMLDEEERKKLGGLLFR
jgi:hypothetical protein